MNHIQKFENFSEESVNESIKSKIITGLIALASLGAGYHLNDIVKNKPEYEIRASKIKDFSIDKDVLNLVGINRQQLENSLGLEPLKPIKYGSNFRTMNKYDGDTSDIKTDLRPGNMLLEFKYRGKKY